MTMRERYLKCCNFEAVDQVPNHELGLWGQTHERWLGEGMPWWACREGWFEGIEYFGMDRREFAHIDLGMYPAFDYELFSEDERYITARHGNGIVTRALKEGTVYGTRMSMDQYISFAVEKPEDFADLKKRYISTDPVRYPTWWDSKCAAWANRDHPLCLGVNCMMGLYSNLRIWMGTENLSFAFFDQSKLVHEMVEFVADFTMETCRHAVETVQFDYFNYFEDFAGKGGPLLSPKIFREFFMPHYKRINEYIREHGINIISMDSDGNTESLIPLMLESGINMHWPCEIASDMEPQKLRKEYGHDLILSGGIDKRELAKDKAAIEHEVMRKVPELIADGGYIPTVDHTVQPDVPYDNFLYYMELKQKCLAGEV